MIHQPNSIGFPSGASYLRPASAATGLEKSIEAQEQGLPIDGLAAKVEDDAFDFLAQWVSQDSEVEAAANLTATPAKAAASRPAEPAVKTERAPTVPITMTSFDHSHLLG